MTDEAEWADIPLFAPDSFVVPKLESGDEESVPSSLAALSHLLYDEETPQEQAELLREKGNTALKRGHHQVKEAVRLYTEAIDIGCEDPEVASANYSNRAAANLKLGNYRYVIDDIEKSLRYEPNNPKGCYRALVACNMLHKYSKAIHYGELGLRALEQNANTSPAMRKPLEEQLEKARKSFSCELLRKQSLEETKEKQHQTEVARREALALRNTVLGAPLFAAQMRNQPRRPTMDASGSLSWPVLFVYPDLESQGVNDLGGNTDFVSQFHEDSILGDQLDEMFPENGMPMPWDPNHSYRASNLEILFRRRWTFTARDMSPGDQLEDFVGSTRGPDEVGSWVVVDKSKMLGEALMTPGYIVPLFPVFFVCPKGFRPK